MPQTDPAPRAALYARFSTELQSDRSVDDQLALCRDYARQHGYRIAGEYSDRARSGTTTHGRAGLQQLMAAARAGRIDAVIVEALDRLSRDQADLATLHKHLTFSGVELIAVHDGKADLIQIGIRGLTSALFVADLKHKIRRGMTGVVRDGRYPGGRAYGYRPTPGQPGELQVYEPEAEVVRRIFADYLAGSVPRQIAAALNAAGIPAPRGARWNGSTINGNSGRSYGILQNPIYGGQIVWNRVRMIRDPDTGKRVSRLNPEAEWQWADAPHLAIVPREEWDRAQRLKELRAHASHRTADKRHRRILSGLLRCPHCGGGMSYHDKTPSGAIRIRCSTAKESGSCSNGRKYRLDRIERAVIDGLIDRLQTPAMIEAFIEAQQADRRDEARTRAIAQRRLTNARGAIDRLQKALVAGRVDEDFFDREIAPMRAELRAAEADLAAAPDDTVITLHPAAIKAHAGVLQVLARHLPDLDPEEDREMFEAFRGLIDRVVIHDRPDGRVDCEVIGKLSALVGSPAGDSWGGSMVAEARYRMFPPMSFGRFAA